MLETIAKAETKRTEAESWKAVRSVSYRINVVVNGIGLDREMAERTEAHSYSGLTEQEARDICAKLKRKGFDVQCYRRINESERIV